MLLMICTLYCECIEETKIGQADMQKTEQKSLIHTYTTLKLEKKPSHIQNVYLLLSFCFKNVIHNVLKLILLKKNIVLFQSVIC